MFHRFYGRHWPVVAVCAALAVMSMMMGLSQFGPDHAQNVETEDRVIDRVEFDGIETTAPAYLQSIVRITPGSVWNRDDIARACARLAATGKFEGSPYAEAREEDGELVLVFVVRERPFVTEIDFVGNSKFKAGDLLDEIELSIGSPISDYLITEARREIERKYKEAGYYHATVEVDREVLRDERRVLFRISEGPRIKVRHIRCEGNTAFSDRELRSKIETATYIWLFRTGAFDDETAQRDAATLKQYYVDHGYLNAQVGYRVELAENGKDMTVIFQVDEGLLHYIKSIRYVGNTVFDDDRIASIMKSAINGPIEAEVLKTDRQSLLAEYGALGYIYAEITTTYVFDEEDGFVNLTVQVSEGDQYTVGRITIRGNRHTKDKVVRRELRFFPEELFDTEEAKRAEQRLLETRLFSEATITPQGEMPGVRDALVDVAESDSTTILFGIGVTSNSGVVGSISIEQRNFDLSDTPRTFKEFFKGRSFRGAGQTLRLSIEPGTELTRGRIEFREPYLLDKEIGFGTGFYVFERGRDEYDERRIGFFTSLDKRWREGPLKDWAAELALRFEHVKISGTDWLTADEIREDEGGNWLTSVKGTILRDKTDSRWLPSEGNRFKVSAEQFGVFGGDHSFTRVVGNYDHYWTVLRDTFDRKHIVQVGATAGQIFGDAPVFERFHGGGIGSIRGFEFRGISPRAGWRDDRIGGDFLVLTNAQYSFPIAGKTVRGVSFLDMGTVEDDFGLSSWRASVGIGARIYIQYFGPIPLAFDFAFPIAKDGDDDTQVFSFSFGTTF
ncbi:MAG: outer membrane protein assembly factor BamA [Phycisphaerae bacterium]|nr:outer membrane protein assembly factor BamA [Phycisphaerae bacterium]